MNAFLKGLCLLTYTIAVIGAVGLLPPGAAGVAENVAMALVAVHVLELPVARKWLPLHPGPMWASVALSLLFGLLHWMPLRQRAMRSQAEAR
jgi:hypothetical protein